MSYTWLCMCTNEHIGVRECVQEKEDQLDRLKKTLKKFKTTHAKQQSQLVDEEDKMEAIRDTDVYVAPGGKKLQVTKLWFV